MAKVYCKKDGKVYWSDDGVYCAAEEAFFELSEFWRARHWMAMMSVISGICRYAGSWMNY